MSVSTRTLTPPRCSASAMAVDPLRSRRHRALPPGADRPRPGGCGRLLAFGGRVGDAPDDALGRDVTLDHAVGVE